jgi:hypothetical protein
VNHFVADGGPAEFATEHDAESVFFEQPQLLRHDERRAIRQRNKSESQHSIVCGLGGLIHDCIFSFTCR